MKNPAHPPKKSNGHAVQGRQIIVIRRVYSDFVRDWEAAEAFNEAAAFWARIVKVEQTTKNLCKVTVSVQQGRYEALTKNLTKPSEVEKAIKSAMEDDHYGILCDYVCAHELDEIPVCEDAVFGPLTVIVEWPQSKARNVRDAIRYASNELSCIELTRLGEIRAKSIVLALSLPLSIFDATVAAMRSVTPRRPLDDCLYEVICQRRESRASDGEGITDLDIPF